jgi:Circularly permutated YpsA SLOG family
VSLPHVARIVSGGQTGADRAALDWARDRCVDRGGWCPRGGLAEDHPDPPGVLAEHPLRETPDASYERRTEWNVRDSDATLLLVLPGAHPTGGTALTLDLARQHGRPHLLAGTDEAPAVRAWLSGLPDGTVLNVAGPGETTAPGIRAAVLALLDEVADG